MAKFRHFQSVASHSERGANLLCFSPEMSIHVAWINKIASEHSACVFSHGKVHLTPVVLESQSGVKSTPKQKTDNIHEEI